MKAGSMGEGGGKKSKWKASWDCSDACYPNTFLLGGGTWRLALGRVVRRSDLTYTYPYPLKL
jgi:hypothetical protein